MMWGLVVLHLRELCLTILNLIFFYIFSEDLVQFISIIDITIEIWTLKLALYIRTQAWHMLYVLRCGSEHSNCSTQYIAEWRLCSKVSYYFDFEI